MSDILRGRSTGSKNVCARLFLKYRKENKNGEIKVSWKKPAGKKTNDQTQVNLINIHLAQTCCALRKNHTTQK